MNSTYTRPSSIPADMGGSGTALDSRLKSILELLKQAPLKRGARVLDIGFGRGQLSRWIADQGMLVTGTGLAIESYNTNHRDLLAGGISIVACPAEALPFSDGTFDVVVMSHVLEHCPNVQLALTEVRRVLKDYGYLLVFVPPHGPHVSAGHISMGWSVGHLLYVCLLAGFSVRNSRFIQWAGSVCGFVQKDTSVLLPPLRGDRGDIQILAAAGHFPLEICTHDGLNDGYWGNIGAINWPQEQLFHLHSMVTMSRIGSVRKAVATKLLHNILPRNARSFISRMLITLGTYIAEGNTNPPFLRG